MNAKQFTKNETAAKVKDEYQEIAHAAELAKELHPLQYDLADYKDQLGDGTRQYQGLTTGYKQIDEAISGLDKFVLLAGRSGAGKTSLALQLALSVIYSSGKKTPVIIYSLEMGRHEIITKLLQTIAKMKTNGAGLYATTIALHGNDPSLPKAQASQLRQALEKLEEISGLIYIKDATKGTPEIQRYTDTPKNVTTIQDDIAEVQETTGSKDVLVVIDSVQDIVKTNNGNQVQAEQLATVELSAIQQATGATILVTAQKNKTSLNARGTIDDQGGVMGSMSFIHKPTTVLELLSPSDIVNDADRLGQIEARAKAGQARPLALRVIKNRYGNRQTIPLSYWGQYSYFTIDSNSLAYANDYKAIGA